MVDVVTEIQIAAPVEKVFEYSADPGNAPLWYVNIKSVEWKTPPLLKVGSRIAFTAHFLGRKLSYVYVIVELILNSRLVMCTDEGPFPMETTYIWEKIDDHITKMTLRNRGLPRGYSKLFAPIMKLMMRKASQKDLQKLKQILEQPVMRMKTFV